MTADSSYQTNGHTAADSPSASTSSGLHHPRDTKLYDITHVDQLPSDAWAEGLAMRPNGDVLATRLDRAELYAVDIRSARNTLKSEFDTIKPRMIHTFPDANSVYNICALPGAEKETYAVVTGTADLAAGEFKNVTLWQVVFEKNDREAAPPSITKTATMSDAMFCVGMVPVSDQLVVVADAAKCCVWRIDVTTGKVSTLLDDPASMSPASETESLGINRVRIAGGYLWYTNTSSGKLYRAAVEHAVDGEDVKVTGTPELVAEGLENADGLTLRRDASAAYVVSYVTGCLWRVDIDAETGKGTTTVLQDDLISPTAMELVYDESGEEEPTLFVMCCGAFDPTWLDGDKGGWLKVANVDASKMHVTVTVETSVTYEYV